MSGVRSLSECSCDHPERLHAIGPWPNARTMPKVFGPSYTEEDMHYRKLQLHEYPRDITDLLKPDEPLSLTLVHRFCNKTCATYYTFPRQKSSENRDDREKVNNQFYAAWFHHGITSYRRGTFLTQEVDVSSMDGIGGTSPNDSPARLQRLVDMHRQLCSRIESRINNVTIADKEREPETDEELIDEGTNTSDHYFTRDQFTFLPSFQRLFLVRDSFADRLTLVKLGVQSSDLSSTSLGGTGGEKYASFTGSPGEVLEKLLEEADLPPSDHPEIMFKGCEMTY